MGVMIVRVTVGLLQVKLAGKPVWQHNRKEGIRKFYTRQSNIHFLKMTKLPASYCVVAVKHAEINLYIAILYSLIIFSESVLGDE